MGAHVSHGGVGAELLARTSRKANRLTGRDALSPLSQRGLRLPCGRYGNGHPADSFPRVDCSHTDNLRGLGWLGRCGPDP